MASSPRKTIIAAGKAAATDSTTAFALQELIACWGQAQEAMMRGDLQCVKDLLDQTDAQIADVGDGSNDTPEEADLRRRASSAYGLLQHAMKSGLNGIRDELGQTRRGAKALRGYNKATARAAGQSRGIS
jgi:hypothetical protein